MSIVGHVSVFVSIVLGLAMVHLLSGVSLILDTRVRTKVYALHLVWTGYMLMAVVLVWLSAFALSPLTQLTIPHVLVLLAYSVVAYLMCGLLYPVRGEEVTDFREHFLANRSRFYVCGLLFTVVDALDGLMEHLQADVPLDVGQFGTLAVWFLMFAVALRAQREALDWALVVVFGVGLVGWLVSLPDAGVLTM